MNNNYDILELFPTPVYSTLLPSNLAGIVNWFYKQEMSEDSDQANYGVRSKNSYILDEPEAVEIKNFILQEIKFFAREVLHYDYEDFKFGQSWLSYKYPGQHHTMHTHPNSLISGVFYFGKEVEKIPAIRFHKMITGVNVSYISPRYKKHKGNSKYAAEYVSVDFKPGLLLLFPSHVLHSVPLNKSEEVRCSLAFNSVPTVGFGQEETLTELKF